MATWSPTANATRCEVLRVTSRGLLSAVGETVTQMRVIPTFRAFFITRMASSVASLPYYLFMKSSWHSSNTTAPAATTDTRCRGPSASRTAPFFCASALRFPHPWKPPCMRS